MNAGGVILMILPWGTGAALCAALGVERVMGWTGLAGMGYVVGWFFAGVTMMILSITGMPWGPGSLGMAVTLPGVLFLGAAWFARRRASPSPEPHAATTVGHSREPAPAVSRSLGILIGVLAFAALAVWLVSSLENVWRPVFPWDAWSYWLARSKAWAANGHVVPFLTEPRWLQDSASGYYRLISGSHPPYVSLVAAWTAVAIGSWKDPLVTLPWIGLLPAIALMIYGALKTRGCDARWCLLGACLPALVPFAVTHVALPGYADLWMAAYVGATGIVLMGGGAQTAWQRTLTLAVLTLAVLGTKSSGVFWLACLLFSVFLATRPLWAIALAGTGAISVLILLVTGSLTGFRVPWVDPRHYELHTAYVVPVFLRTLFASANWGPLWWGAASLAVATRWTGRARGWSPGHGTVLLVSLAALFAVYSLTDLSKAATSLHTLNRSLLALLVPACLFVASSCEMLEAGRLPRPGAR